MGCRPRSTCPPGASRACLRLGDRSVQRNPAVPVRSAGRPAPGSASGSPPSTGTSARRWRSWRPRPGPHDGRTDCRPQGVRHPGRPPAVDRPDRRRPPLLLGQTQETRHERTSPRRPGQPLWASPALARRQRALLGRQGVPGSGGTVRVPYRGRWDKLSEGQQAVNASHAKIRALGEQAVVALKIGGGCASCAAARPASPTWSRSSSRFTWRPQAELENAQSDTRILTIR